mgnify:CR=1 FL=1
MLHRLTFLLKTFLWTMLLFIMGKVGFMFYNNTNHVFSLGDMWDVVVHGITLEAKIGRASCRERV